jgi:PAS domain S-box-containing protein
MSDERIEDLVRRIADAETELQDFIHSQVDAVLDPVSATPILLRETQSALQVTNELLERVFASIDILIAFMDRDFNFLRVNRAYAKADNREPAFFIGKNHFDLYPDEENQAIFRRVVETGQPYYVYEKAFEYQDAPERGMTYWDRSLQPVNDLHGVVQGVILSLINVTDRKRAEDRVLLSARRSETLASISRKLVEAGPDYQAVIETVVSSVASALSCASILMLASDDGEWLEIAAYFPCGAHLATINEESFKNCRISSSEDTVFGSVYQTSVAVLISPVCPPNYEQADLQELFPLTGLGSWGSVIVVPLRLPGRNIGTLVAARGPGEELLFKEDQSLLQSVADQASLAVVNARLYHDLEKALREEKEIHSQLVQAEKHAALSRMVASVAHELNNPVQTIQNCLYLTSQDLAPESPIQEYLEMALSETQRVARLVAQLRAIYRPNRRDAMQTLNLVQLLEDCRTLLEPHLQHEHVSLQFECPEQEIAILGIPDQIKQVILNLSLNAIEAVQPGGGLLAITVNQQAEDDWVEIEFKDTGPGIPEEHLSRLFDPFFTTKETGLGLGLAICDDIVRGHGGQILVESQPGAGAQLTVRLPLFSKV